MGCEDYFYDLFFYRTTHPYGMHFIIISRHGIHHPLRNAHTFPAPDGSERTPDAVDRRSGVIFCVGYAGDQRGDGQCPDVAAIDGFRNKGTIQK